VLVLCDRDDAVLLGVDDPAAARSWAVQALRSRGQYLYFSIPGLFLGF
jgi:hypothetical protein